MCFTMRGSVKDVTAERLFYEIDTFGGQSGSASYDEVDSSIRGIHAYGGCWNR